MSVQIKKCNCKHEYQDKVYGQGMRVCNEDSKKQATCTVCGTKHK